MNLFPPKQAKPLPHKGNFQERRFVLEFLQKQNLRQGFECTELIWEMGSEREKGRNPIWVSHPAVTTVGTWAWSFQEHWERVQNTTLWASDSGEGAGELIHSPQVIGWGLILGTQYPGSPGRPCKRAEMNRVLSTRVCRAQASATLRDHKITTNQQKGWEH